MGDGGGGGESGAANGKAAFCRRIIESRHPPRLPCRVSYGTASAQLLQGALEEKPSNSVTAFR